MHKLAEHRFADVKVGDSASFDVTLTSDMVEKFAELSGDMNPLHMDESYAATTEFKGRIPHGMLGGSFFSRLVGMYLPGKYALYLSQSLMFRKPMKIGVKLTIRGTIIQKIDVAQAIKIHTEVLDRSEDQCLIDGEALVKVLE